MKQSTDFLRVWGGVAGIESALAVLLDEGHHRRGLPLTDIARLTAARPASRFRIRNKGSIAVGMDADLTFVDLSSAFTLRAEKLFQKHRFSPYAGRTFLGHVCRTILRGVTIFSDGQVSMGARGLLVVP